MIDEPHSSSPIPPEIIFARTVLEFCAIGRLSAANTFVLKLREAGGISTAAPLIQFSLFILRVLERDALHLFNQLERYYAPAFQKDPVISKHLITIAFVYFGEKRTRPGLGGLGSLMQSMLGGMSQA